jgi:hypothetical protein
MNRRAQYGSGRRGAVFGGTDFSLYGRFGRRELRGVGFHHCAFRRMSCKTLFGCFGCQFLIKRGHAFRLGIIGIDISG